MPRLSIRRCFGSRLFGGRSIQGARAVTIAAAIVLRSSSTSGARDLSLVLAQAPCKYEAVSVWICDCFPALGENRVLFAVVVQSSSRRARSTEHGPEYYYAFGRNVRYKDRIQCNCEYPCPQETRDVECGVGHAAFYCVSLVGAFEVSVR